MGIKIAGQQGLRISTDEAAEPIDRAERPQKSPASSDKGLKEQLPGFLTKTIKAPAYPKITLNRAESVKPTAPPAEIQPDSGSRSPTGSMGSFGSNPEDSTRSNRDAIKLPEQYADDVTPESRIAQGDKASMAIADMQAAARAIEAQGTRRFLVRIPIRPETLQAPHRRPAAAAAATKRAKLFVFLMSLLLTLCFVCL